MSFGLVLYYSKYGKTRELAALIGAGMESAGLEARLRTVPSIMESEIAATPEAVSISKNVSAVVPDAGDPYVILDDFTNCCALALGSPTRFGKNGMGKSTLIKTITGLIPALSGEINIHTKTKIGYFHQHTIDFLDLNKTPLQTFIDLSQSTDSTISAATTSKMRSFLGGFAFSGNVVNQPITNFSGGEKTRLALAMIVWQQPNLLLLDEPTNHLDLDMRESLAIALQSFNGAVILVSHDQHLLQTTADRLLLIENKGLKDYQGDLSDYLSYSL